MNVRSSSAPPSIELFDAAHLRRMPWLVHGFSMRRGGCSKVYGGDALNLGFTTHDSKAAVERNRRVFISAITRELKPAGRSASAKWRLVSLRQIHSDLIHRVRDIPQETLTGDGLVTDVPAILLAVLAADCLPIILVDPKHRAVGVFHAGWRGTAKRIIEKGVGEMRRSFGTDPRQLQAALGPGIRGCCYEVGPEVRSAFESQFPGGSGFFRETRERDAVHERYPLFFLSARAPGHSQLPNKIFLDLAEVNRQQLIAAGVPAKNVSDVGLCTSCRVDLFFSHRADKGITGRMMAAVGIRE
jgi:polyphenol oxidase